MSINKLINQIKKDTIKRETEVRTKIIYPLLDELKYKRENIVDEFPVYAKEGRKDLPAKSADIMIFSNSGANNYKENNENDINWVRKNSLIAIELKKPTEKIKEAKEQATFYAMWTRCLIYIITNGEDIEIYQLKDFSADILLFVGKILDLNSIWDELYRILHFNSLKQKKINPITKPKEVVISSNSWEEIFFGEERDITDAILGNKLFPYNVKACPELPILKRLKDKLELSNYVIIKGVSGCGKSITAYQLGYYYKNNGYNVYRYINNNDEFDYDIKSLASEKSVFIIDDLQNILDISIDKIIANTSKDLKFICTITEGISIEAESTYLSTTESIKTIKNYYLSNREMIYNIIHKVDSNIDDTYLSETLEDRLNKAEKEANSPWMFNYILRGGWNIAKNDYYQAKDNKRFDWILLYIALNQIANLDKAISFSRIEKILEFFEYDKEWLISGLSYLVTNKIIIKEENCYRCIHIRYASLILNKMSRDLSKEEMQILINMIQEIIVDNSNLLGISWLLNEFRCHELWYYEKNIITEDIWKIIEKKCFSAEKDIDIRNACFVLEIAIRFFNNAKRKIIENNIDLLCEWINNINFTNGFALRTLINSLLDYREKNSLINKEFQDKIDFEKIADRINNADYKELGTIGYFLERLCAFDNDSWKNAIVTNIKIELITNNIKKHKDIIDIWYLSQFITSLYYMDKEKGLILYDNLEEIFLSSFRNDALQSYEAIDDRLLWMVFGFSLLDNKRPAKKFIKRAKKLVNSINPKSLAQSICNSNNPDWERYGRLNLFVNRVDTSVTKKVIDELDLELLKTKLNQYWNSLPHEMRLLLITLAEATDDNEPIKSIIEENIEKIPFVEPILVYINNNILVKGFEKKLLVDLFNYNQSYEMALDILKISKDLGEEYFIYCLEQSKNQIREEIENIFPMRAIYDTSISEFINYISKNSIEITQEIFNNLNSQKMIENLMKYDKEKSRNKDSNITLYTLCINIIKYNEDINLRDIATTILKKIPARYKVN